MEKNITYGGPFLFSLFFIFLIYLLAFPTCALSSNNNFLNNSKQNKLIARVRFIYNRPKIIPLFGINYSYIKNKSMSSIPLEFQNMYTNPYLRNPISIWFEEYINVIVTDKYKSLEKKVNNKTGIDKNSGKMYFEMKYSQISSPLIYDKSIDMTLLTASGIIERKILLILEKIYTISAFKLSILDEDRSGKQYYGLFFSKPSSFFHSKITGKLLLTKYEEEMNNDLNERYWSIGEIGLNWHEGIPFFNKFEKFSFPLTATIDGNVIIPDTDLTIFPGIGMELKPTFNFSIRNKLSFKMNFYVNTNNFIDYHAIINHAIAF